MLIELIGLVYLTLMKHLSKKMEFSLKHYMSLHAIQNNEMGFGPFVDLPQTRFNARTFGLHKEHGINGILKAFFAEEIVSVTAFQQQLLIIFVNLSSETPPNPLSIKLAINISFSVG